MHPLDEPIDKTRWQRGTKSTYRTEYCQVVVELLAQGLAKIEVAAELGIRRSTLDEWQETYPEFAEAMREGLELSEAWWHKQGRENLKHNGFQTPLYKFNMAHRFKIYDRIETNHITHVTQEEALKQLAQGVTIEGEVWTPPAVKSDKD
jgi:hypothetical protein